MSSSIVGTSDAILEQIADVLREYEVAHPRAQIHIRRQNSVSVRVRVIDPDFAGMSRTARHQLVRAVLEKLPDDAFGDITMILALTPEELSGSLVNAEFENPTPSTLW